jgi:hypothetical protein
MKGVSKERNMAFGDKDFEWLLQTLKFDDSLELDADYYGNIDSWSYPEAVALLTCPPKTDPFAMLGFGSKI